MIERLIDKPMPIPSAFVVGSVVYWALAKAGLRPPVIPEYQLTPPMQTAVRVP